MTTGTDLAFCLCTCSSPRRYPTETPAGQNLPLFRQQFSRTFFSVILFVLCFKHKMWLTLEKKVNYKVIPIVLIANINEKEEEDLLPFPV